MYRKALEMTSKAPGLHAELQKQLREAQVRCAPGYLAALLVPRQLPQDARVNENQYARPADAGAGEGASPCTL